MKAYKSKKIAMTNSITLHLDDEMNKRLSTLADTRDRQKCDLAMQALKLFLDCNEWQVKTIQQALVEADNASPDEFIENDAVFTWMETWGTTDEGEAPL